MHLYPVIIFIDQRGIFVYYRDLDFVLCEEEGNDRVDPTVTVSVWEEDYLEKVNVVVLIYPVQASSVTVSSVQAVSHDGEVDLVVRSLAK